MADKTIGVSEVTAQDLAKVASKNKVSRDMVISKMLTFFQTYGIDPFNYEAPHEEMTKIIKRFDQMFAFIKKQEKDMLVPTLTRLATKEDHVTQGEIYLSNMNELLRLLRVENRELKEELTRVREGAKIEHQEVINLVSSNVSNMLQEVTKSLGIGGQKKDVTLAELQNYER